MSWKTGGTLTFNDVKDVVCHVVGSSAQKPPGAPCWRDYWERNTQKTWPKTCQLYGCSKPATLGAHIYANKSQENFILPACSTCNNDNDAHYTLYKLNAVGAWVERHPNTY